MKRLARGQAGQAIVEMALLFPVMCGLVLAALDTGFLTWQVQRAQAAATTIAMLVAQDATTNGQIADLAADAGCRDANVDIGGHRPLVVVTIHCAYRSLTTLLPDGYEVASNSVVPAPAATPMPQPTYPPMPTYPPVQP